MTSSPLATEHALCRPAGRLGSHRPPLEQTVTVAGTDIAGIVLGQLAAQLAQLRTAHAEIFERVEALVEEHPLHSLLTSMPAVGRALGSGEHPGLLGARSDKRRVGLRSLRELDAVDAAVVHPQKRAEQIPGRIVVSRMDELRLLRALVVDKQSSAALFVAVLPRGAVEILDGEDELFLEPTAEVGDGPERRLGRGQGRGSRAPAGTTARKE